MACKTKIAYIHGLAYDNLVQIFEHFVYLNAAIEDHIALGLLAGTQKQSMMAIGHTCGRWRHILHSTPSLWTYIYILPHNNAIVNYAKLSLSLSATLPVTIFYHAWPSEDEDPMFNDVVGNISRVQRLTIYMPCILEIWLSKDRALADAPLLEEFKIVQIDPCLSMPTHHYPNLSFVTSPRLRHVDIAAWAPRLVSHNFTALTSLAIRLPAGSIGDLSLPLTQCLLAAPPQLEELLIAPNGRPRPQSSRNQADLDATSLPVLSFPRLRKLAIAWFGGDVELRALLTSLRIPNGASRQIMPSYNPFNTANPFSLNDYIYLGRIQQAPQFHIIRKLYILDNQNDRSDALYRIPDRYIAIDGDTLALNPFSTRTTELSHSVLSGIEELNVISPSKQPYLFSAEIVLPALLSLRKLTVSTDGGVKIMKPIAKVLCERSTMYGATSPALVCPQLEEVGLYYYNPSNLPRSQEEGPEIIEEGASLLFLAQERKRKGAMLKEVTFERRHPDLEWSLLECVTKRVTPIRRWVGCPEGYFENEIREWHKWCRGI